MPLNLYAAVFTKGATKGMELLLPVFVVGVGY